MKNNINEETRTVSGFTEFIHNGKNSIMEEDTNVTIKLNKNNIKNFHTAHSIVFSDFLHNFYDFCVAIDNLEEKNNPKSIAFNTFNNICFIENKNIFNNEIVNITKSIYLYKLNINEPYAYGGYFIHNNTPYIFLSKININEENSIEKYNAIISIIAEKKFSKMPILKILGCKEMIKEKYFEKYKQSEDNPNIFIYKNPYYIEPKTKKEKEDNNKNKNQVNRKNNIENHSDKISNDKSTLLDKKEKKQKDKTNSIVKTVANGYQKGINGAKSNANFLKTIYNAYKEEKDKLKNN